MDGVQLYARDLNKMSVSGVVDQKSWRPLLAALDFNKEAQSWRNALGAPGSLSQWSVGLFNLWVVSLNPTLDIESTLKIFRKVFQFFEIALHLAHP